MATPPTHIPAFVVLALANLGACAPVHPLPLREQCIVKVVSLDPATTNFDTDGLPGLVVDAHRIGIPLASIAVSGNDVLYLQFRKDCENRFRMSDRVLLLRFPASAFRVDHGKVTPGIRTIDAYGEWWSDGEVDWPWQTQP